MQDAVLKPFLAALMVWRGGASMAARIAALLELRDALSDRLPLAGIVDGKFFKGATSVLAAYRTCSISLCMVGLLLSCPPRHACNITQAT